MTRKRKSGFLTFCFSMIPGAGEMYLGFMKMGISLMSLFFGIMMLSMLLNMGIVMIAEIVLWFYSFFHVHNLAGLSDEEFLQVKDEFLIDLDMLFAVKRDAEKYRKITAVVLIVIGGLLLWNGLKWTFMPWIPDFIFKALSRFENTIFRILLGIIIMVAGVRMIKGKQEEVKEVIIEVSSEDVEDGRDARRKAEKEETDLASGMMAERRAYGTEAERKDP